MTSAPSGSSAPVSVCPPVVSGEDQGNVIKEQLQSGAGGSELRATLNLIISFKCAREHSLTETILYITVVRSLNL